MDTTRRTLLIKIRNTADQGAWRQFDAIYRPLMLRFLRSRRLDAATADDVVQECMLKLRTYIASFDYDPERGSFKGWLFTMLSRQLLNYKRKRREVHAGSGVLDGTADEQRTPEEAFEAIWLDEHLRHCLNQLAGELDEQKMAVYRRYVLRGESAGDVAAQFGLTEQQVYSIKFKVTERLRQAMIELVGEDE